MKKVIIATGGTGGHLFPAQACACDLRKKMNNLDILFVGKDLKISPRFNREKFQFQDVQSAPFSKNPWQYLTAGPKVMLGVLQSLRILKNFKPQCVIGFGSFHSFPMLAAASLLSIPFILHESNTVPGKVNTLFSKKALWTGIFFPDTQDHLLGVSKITTIPLRDGFAENFRPSKEEAIKYYGLEEDKKILLVFGGSQGASFLNRIIMETISLLSSSLQVIHFTGDSNYSEKARECYRKYNVNASVKDFESKMQYAWSAADATILRAGALSCAELLSFKVPSILVPYPYSSEKHQQKNAEYIENVVGGGKVLNESSIHPRQLAAELMAFLDERNLTKVQENIINHEKKLARQDFSELVYQTLQEVTS